MGQSPCCCGVVSALLGPWNGGHSGGGGGSGHAAKPYKTNRPSRVVLSKYRMYTGEDDVMGEGSYCVCRRGVCLATGEAVAIKVYKASFGKAAKVTLTKFRRQIEVLEELQKPLAEVPGAPWDDRLANLDPMKLFVRLVDYSRGGDGRPGADPVDKVTYVVMELGQYSLKDYLQLRRDQSDPPAPETVRVVTRAMVLVVAGLHSKGLVHLDLKPENLMLFQGCLKLIDVDGCVRIGTSASIDDSSLSFSPCYCAPEWARFLVESGERSTIKISPKLDVWSVGATVCELVTLEAIMYPVYNSFLKHGRTHHQAAFLFLDWLSCAKRVRLPASIGQLDWDLLDLLSRHLLVCCPTSRRNLTDCLGHPFLNRPSLRKHRGLSDWNLDIIRGEECGMPIAVPTHRRHRVEDCSRAAVHKGTLWKLNSDGNPRDASHWLKRDMWLSANGSLCYFSLRDYKRLVLLDANRMSVARIEPFEGGAMRHAFQIRTQTENRGPGHVLVFACSSQAAYAEWTRVLSKVRSATFASIHLGTSVARELRGFKLMVRNRRMKLARSCSDQLEAIHQGNLWKLKVDGESRSDLDWFERQMWLARDGSLVYWSEKEERQLVYYTSSDVAHAHVQCIPEGRTCRPWAFQVLVAATGGLEFAPGEFAAETAEMRDSWIRAFEQAGAEVVEKC